MHAPNHGGEVGDDQLNHILGGGFILGTKDGILGPAGHIESKAARKISDAHLSYTHLISTFDIQPPIGRRNRPSAGIQPPRGSDSGEISLL